MTKPIFYIPQPIPVIQNYPQGSAPKKSIPPAATYTPPARNIQSQLGRPPSTHVDDFEKSKISIKPQLPQQDIPVENKEQMPGETLPLPRTPSPSNMKDMQLVFVFF